MLVLREQKFDPLPIKDAELAQGLAQSLPFGAILTTELSGEACLSVFNHNLGNIMGFKARKHIRYKPDKLDVALVMYDGNSAGWNPDDVGIIIDESAISGAQLIMRKSHRLQVSETIKVKLGSLEPMLAEVSWRKEVEGDLCRVGVKLLE